MLPTVEQLFFWCFREYLVGLKNGGTFYKILISELRILTDCKFDWIYFHWRDSTAPALTYIGKGKLRSLVRWSQIGGKNLYSMWLLYSMWFIPHASDENDRWYSGRTRASLEKKSPALSRLFKATIFRTFKKHYFWPLELLLNNFYAKWDEAVLNFSFMHNFWMN